MAPEGPATEVRSPPLGHLQKEKQVFLPHGDLGPHWAVETVSKQLLHTQEVRGGLGGREEMNRCGHSAHPLLPCGAHS